MSKRQKDWHRLRMQRERLRAMIEEMEEIQEQIGLAASSLGLHEETMVSFDMDFHRILGSLEGAVGILGLLVAGAQAAQAPQEDPPTGT